MTRISENQLHLAMVTNIFRNKEQVAKYSDQVSSGLKVKNPGDSDQSGAIVQFQDTLQRIEGHKIRVASIKGSLDFQDNVLKEANDLLVRAKEIATQSANETIGATGRSQMAAELWEIRDHMVSLANSTYQGKYVFAGTDDDDPPYDALTYTTPASGGANKRYIYDPLVGPDLGGDKVRTVKITDDFEMEVNIPGNRIFDNAIQGLERLGRALSGYSTTLTTGVPDGGGAAYTFPQEYSQQTQDIQSAITVLDTARQNDIMVYRTQVGGKSRRLETAESILGIAKQSAQNVLAEVQAADITEAASDLQQARTALEASMTVTSRVLQRSIMDYL